MSTEVSLEEEDKQNTDTSNSTDEKDNSVEEENVIEPNPVALEWKHREFMETIETSIRKIVDFLNNFNDSCRFKLSTIDQRLTSLERKLDFIENSLKFVDPLKRHHQFLIHPIPFETSIFNPVVRNKLITTHQLLQKQGRKFHSKIIAPKAVQKIFPVLTTQKHKPKIATHSSKYSKAQFKKIKQFIKLKNKQTKIKGALTVAGYIRIHSIKFNLETIDLTFMYFSTPFWPHGQQNKIDIYNVDSAGYTIKPNHGSLVEISCQGYLCRSYHNLFENLSLQSQFIVQDHITIELNLRQSKARPWERLTGRMVNIFDNKIADITPLSSILLWIPFSLAFGKNGVKNLVPHNCDILFEITLHKIVEFPKPKYLRPMLRSPPVPTTRTRHLYSQEFNSHRNYINFKNQQLKDEIKLTLYAFSRQSYLQIPTDIINHIILFCYIPYFPHNKTNEIDIYEISKALPTKSRYQGNTKMSNHTIVFIEITGYICRDLQHLQQFLYEDSLQLHLGQNSAIKGLIMGLLKMHVKERQTIMLWCPAKLSYGNGKGITNLIPPNTNILFDITLHSIQNPPVPPPPFPHAPPPFFFSRPPPVPIPGAPPVPGSRRPPIPRPGPPPVPVPGSLHPVYPPKKPFRKEVERKIPFPFNDRQSIDAIVIHSPIISKRVCWYASVSIEYSIYLYDEYVKNRRTAKVIVSSVNDVYVKLGNKMIITGLEMAILNIKLGASIKLYIPSKLAFGNKENNLIPKNADLIFDLKLKKENDWRFKPPKVKIPWKTMSEIKQIQIDKNQKLRRKNGILVSGYTRFFELKFNLNIPHEIRHIICIWYHCDRIQFPHENPKIIDMYIIKDNPIGMMPNSTDKVEIEYIGFLCSNIVDDKKQFIKHREIIHMGRKQNIRGLEQALINMAAGSSVKLWIPSRLAYGVRGAGSLIPPNCDLLFNLTLHRICLS
eukprot:430865_1